MPTETPLETALYAPGIVIGYENVMNLEELERQFTADPPPATPTERSLVDSLIHIEWMLRRYRWLETEVWKAACLELPPDARTRSWPGHAFVLQPAIGRIHRLRAAAHRGFRETLAQLRRLQSERR